MNIDCFITFSLSDLRWCLMTMVQVNSRRYLMLTRLTFIPTICLAWYFAWSEPKPRMLSLIGFRLLMVCRFGTKCQEGIRNLITMVLLLCWIIGGLAVAPQGLISLDVMSCFALRSFTVLRLQRLGTSFLLPFSKKRPSQFFGCKQHAQWQSEVRRSRRRYYDIYAREVCCWKVLKCKYYSTQLISAKLLYPSYFTILILLFSL